MLALLSACGDPLAAPGSVAEPGLGPGASLEGRRSFPDDNPWNTDGSQPGVPVTFNYGDESDPGPYPIPPDVPIEGGPEATGDRHILIVDRDSWVLYDLFAAYPGRRSTTWHAGSGAIFDLGSNALPAPTRGMDLGGRGGPSHLPGPRPL